VVTCEIATVTARSRGLLRRAALVVDHVDAVNLPTTRPAWPPVRAAAAALLAAPGSSRSCT